MSPSHALPATSRAPRRGTTVVELLIALIVLTVGLLALAGAAAIIARETAAARRELTLAWMARARLERLASEGCDTLDSGLENGAGISERWTVAESRNDTRRITVTVRQVVLGGAVVRRLEGIVACG